MSPHPLAQSDANEQLRSPNRAWLPIALRGERNQLFLSYLAKPGWASAAVWSRQTEPVDEGT